MKVALVYDRINKIGGAERVLTALHEIWPDAPLYTAVYNPKTATWANGIKVFPSFLQKFPLAKTRHELYPWLTPLAFENFNFNDFDVVISITSAEAKGVITSPGTLHLCYCLTPTRYLWSGTLNYPVRAFLKPVISRMRVWDQIASQRPDTYIAISNVVAQRIRKYYRRDSKIIYPPVDTLKWQIQPRKKKEDPYFLVVSRLVPYKRVDLAIEAFNKLKLPLKIVGLGSEMKRLKKLAQENITFLGQLTDEQVLRYYQNCQAVIFPQEEDFGLVPLEAQACGKPVIAFKAGGSLETIIEGKTGEFFLEQTPEALIKVVEKFEPVKYKPADCRLQAEKFSKSVFKKQFRKLVEQEWRTFWKNISTS